MSVAAGSAGGFGGGLSFSTQVPLEFREQTAELLPSTLARLNAENLQVLHADTSIAESHRLVDAKDDDRPWLADLARLEYKLDVLLGIVGRLLSRDASMPAMTAVRIHADGVEWLSRDVRPVSGSRGLLTLYINPSFPQPLVMPGRVTGHRADTEGLWAQFAFEGTSAAVVDLLERLVFRHHRRQIAESRGG